MRVHSLQLENFGPFEQLSEIKMGALATIVGQNDVGKSYILRALAVFFDEQKMEERHINDGASDSDEIAIEVAFTNLPESFELEDGVATSLNAEMLLDKDGLLRIRHTYSRENTKNPTICLVVSDYEDDQYAELALLNERDLNSRSKQLDLPVQKSGRGVTNMSKREEIRRYARKHDAPIAKRELKLKARDRLWTQIKRHLPKYVLFETDTKLGVGETSFQSNFRPIVSNAATDQDVIAARDQFTGAITQSLQNEVDGIFERLRRHTDAFTSLKVDPEFSWDKAVTFDIGGKDEFGIEKPLEQRGSGLRRLLMVAFFQYLSEKGLKETSEFVFAVEEPENCLHPKLQRELAQSFRNLDEQGYQVILSTHSPVFAGASPVSDLALVLRSKGVAYSQQYPELDLADIAEQLGVEPSDQIIGYKACLFVEGPKDVEFWNSLARTFKDGGKISKDFEDLQIGIVPFGGENLKHWISLGAMSKLNRRFAVVVDSDRQNPRVCRQSKGVVS